MLDDKEMYLVLQDTVGKRLARWGLWIGFLGAVSVALLASGALISSTATHVVKPALALLPAGFSTSGLDAAFLSLGVSISLVVLVAGVIIYWVRAGERRLFDRFDTNLRPRLEGIFAKLTDIDVQALNRFQSLNERLEAVEKCAATQPGLAPAANLVDEPEPDLTVHFARYGFGDQWADVTTAVRGLVKDGKIGVLVTNDVLGCAGDKDPYKGQRKTLEVTYSQAGTLRPPLTVTEKTRLVMPIEPHSPQKPQIRVRAKSMGFYGNTRRRRGDEFTLKSESEFSQQWMERI